MIKNILQLTKTLIGSVTVLLMLVSFGGQASAAFPEKPVRIVLAFGTGGVSDIVSRLLAKHLEEKFGVRFIVDNKPGANGTKAAQSVLSSDNQGYTLLNTGNTGTIRETLYPNLPYNQLKDFEPVTPIATFDLALVTAPNSDIKSVQDLIKKAKANPGTVTIGSVAVGSTQNLSANLFIAVTGIDATVVPFKKTPESMAGVARGEVDVAFEIIAGAKNPIKSGQVKLLATTGAQRSKVFPDAPTVEESGVRPFVVGSWNAYSAPNGIPASHAKILSDEIQRIMRKPEVAETMISYGIEPFYGDAETVRERQKVDVAKWAKIIKDAGIPIKK